MAFSGEVDSFSYIKTAELAINIQCFTKIISTAAPLQNETTDATARPVLTATVTPALSLLHKKRSQMVRVEHQKEEVEEKNLKKQKNTKTGKKDLITFPRVFRRPVFLTLQAGE